jgi:hypothetical protein
MRAVKTTATYNVQFQLISHKFYTTFFSIMNEQKIILSW